MSIIYALSLWAPFNGTAGAFYFEEVSLSCAGNERKDGSGKNQGDSCSCSGGFCWRSCSIQTLSSLLLSTCRRPSSKESKMPMRSSTNSLATSMHKPRCKTPPLLSPWQPPSPPPVFRQKVHFAYPSPTNLRRPPPRFVPFNLHPSPSSPSPSSCIIQLAPSRWLGVPSLRFPKTMSLMPLRYCLQMISMR